MYEPKRVNISSSKEAEIILQIRELKKQLPKQQTKRRKLPDYPTYEEFSKFMLALKEQKYKKEYILCFVLAFEAGMRISEILGLRSKSGNWSVPPLIPENVDLNRNIIKIISGKGSRDRTVPLPKDFNERALKLLPLYNKFGRRIIQKVSIKKTKEILGRPLSIHKFRHGFASHLANMNIPINQIQMWMGHSRADITSIYLHASPSKENIDKVRELF